MHDLSHLPNITMFVLLLVIYNEIQVIGFENADAFQVTPATFTPQTVRRLLTAKELAWLSNHKPIDALEAVSLGFAEAHIANLSAATYLIQKKEGLGWSTATAPQSASLFQ